MKIYKNILKLSIDRKFCIKAHKNIELRSTGQGQKIDQLKID